jgi:hypothetical protein
MNKHKRTEQRGGLEHLREQQLKPEAPAVDAGLVGFFGHTYIVREGKRQLQFQFRVVRALPPDRWIVQLYNFFDGAPNQVAVYSEDFLFGENCALYPDAATWHAAYSDYDRSRAAMEE